MDSKIIKFSYKSFLVIFISLNLFHIDLLEALNEPIIKVLIKKDNNLRIRADSTIPLIIKGNRLFNKKIKGLTLKNKGNKKFLSFDKNKDKLYEFDKDGFIIRSLDRRGIWVGDKRYLGIIRIILIDNKINVVNEIGIEKYLSSVVGAEMPHKWPIEALKAQAISSRTYALKKKGNLIFDIDSTQKDQVYNGLESRTLKTQRAVSATRSLVLVKNNKLINALFHSSSGGQTENSEDVWSNKYSYLRSVKDYDQNNPKLNWYKSFSKSELKNVFPHIGGIEEIRTLKRTSTNRIKLLEITGANGSKQFSGKEFRDRLKLKSTLFKYVFINSVSNEKINLNNKLNGSSKSYFRVLGKGAGHGVGMSQWGAKYLASKGHKADRILKHFYKGVYIKPFKSIYK